MRPLFFMLFRDAIHPRFIDKVMYSAASCIINNIRLVSVVRQGIGRNRYACCGVSDISGTGFAKDSDSFDVSFSGRSPFPSFCRFTGNVLVTYTNILRHRVRSLRTDRNMLAFNRGTGFTKGLCVCGSLYSGTEALFPFLRSFSSALCGPFPHKPCSVSFSGLSVCGKDKNRPQITRFAQDICRRSGTVSENTFVSEGFHSGIGCPFPFLIETNRIEVIFKANFRVAGHTRSGPFSSRVFLLDFCSGGFP